MYIWNLIFQYHIPILRGHRWYSDMKDISIHIARTVLYFFMCLLLVCEIVFSQGFTLYITSGDTRHAIPQFTSSLLFVIVYVLFVYIGQIKSSVGKSSSLS